MSIAQNFDSTNTDPSKLVSNQLTGAKRENKVGKGRFDLIPYCALLRLAKHYENGAVHHGDRNWEKGLPVEMYYNAAMRHLNQWFHGLDDSEDHLAAALWNLCGLIHHEESLISGKIPFQLLQNCPADLQKRIAALHNSKAIFPVFPGVTKTPVGNEVYLNPRKTETQNEFGGASRPQTNNGRMPIDREPEPTPAPPQKRM